MMRTRASKIRVGRAAGVYALNADRPDSQIYHIVPYHLLVVTVE
ncbi:hypothetical protein DFR70_13014 [Nocardia tenerifensis]|uniref:Uncharacterized protein n=1 Tax=Nocardia tenerifensis TaxID=228006 RepID=A0A318JRP6_9NOCA|nr:hypothetical protein DFR70_13014 [Nocardia tenerifensis]